MLPMASATHADTQNKLHIFSAASTFFPLKEIILSYQQRSGKRVVPVLAASGALARQIDQGAPADIFISANKKWMDWLESRDHLREGSRKNLIGNCLVVVQPKDARILSSLSNTFVQSLGHRRIAIGDPSYVPAGEYARSALSQLGLWKFLEQKTARMPSVRQVMYLVERSEAAAGIVYRSDALSNNSTKITETIKSELYDEIVYPIALIANRPSKSEVLELYNFILSKTALAIFKRYGFQYLGRSCSR